MSHTLPLHSLLVLGNKAFFQRIFGKLIITIPPATATTTFVAGVSGVNERASHLTDFPIENVF